MQAADLEVIKEVPGYRVILKAVLKNLIQQLVEQLADHTGEESVILTASALDGSLSHLGSESGKVFLDDHDDIKSRFLDFCLKRHHSQKPREEQKHQSFCDPVGMIQAVSTTSANFGTGQRPRLSASPHENFDSASQIGVYPVSLTRAVPSFISRGRNRNNGIRHEPYSTAHPQNTSVSSDEQRLFTNPNEAETSAPLNRPLESVDISNNLILNKNIKVEAASELEESGTHEQSQKSSAGQLETSEYSSDSEFTKSHTVDSVISNTTGIPSEQFKSEPIVTSNLVAVADIGILPVLVTEKDPNVNIKVEAVTEDEMDLEIIGIEPGQLSQSSQALEPQTGNRNGTEQTEAIGSQLSQNDGDVSTLSRFPQGDVHGKRTTSFYCRTCGKTFSSNYNLKVHTRIHTGDFPFHCNICGRRFNQKGNFQAHQLIHSK